MIIRSVVDGLRVPPPYSLVQGGLLRTHPLALPLHDRRMDRRVRPLLDDLLLARASVLELRVTAEVASLGLQRLEGDLLEGPQRGIEGRVGAGGGTGRFAFEQPIVFLLMLCHPEFVVLAVWRYAWRNGVWAVVTGSGNDAAESVGVLVEKNTFSDTGGMLDTLLTFLLLLQRFLKVVGAYSGTLAFLLVEFDEIEVGALGQLAIHLQTGPFLSQFLKIPRLLLAVGVRGGNALGHLQLVVHVEATPSHVSPVLLALLLRLPLTLLHLETGVYLETRRAVLWNGPRNVLVRRVTVHGARVDRVEAVFGVQHANKIMNGKRFAQEQRQCTGINISLTNPGRSFLQPELSSPTREASPALNVAARPLT